jgi:hypothetical protein
MLFRLRAGERGTIDPPNRDRPTRHSHCLGCMQSPKTENGFFSSLHISALPRLPRVSPRHAAGIQPVNIGPIKTARSPLVHSFTLIS